MSTDFADPSEIVSIDPSQPFDPSYEVSLPDDLPARCTPISAQATCRSYALERSNP